MKINKLALLTAVAMSLSTAALADGPGFLRSADLNHDGVIDQSEYQTARDNWFQDLDANKDGFISSDELKAASAKLHAAWAQRHADTAKAQQGAAAGTTPPADTARESRFADRMMKRLDTDQDGKISKAEFDTDGAAFFKRLDKNGDGKIASDEMPARGPAAFAQHMFDRMDQDKDGKVTKAEFTAAGEQLFTKLDVNGDGVLTKDEIKLPKFGHGGMMGPDGAAPADQAPTP